MMVILPNLIVFIFGACVGSFLNCVIYRISLKDKSLIKDNNLSDSSRDKPSFLKGRSFCPRCHQTLRWYDLIPIFSFVFLGGKCRYCHQKISWQYPVVEIATGLIFLLIIIYHLSFINFLYLSIISCFLIIIAVYDLRHYIIPDEVIYPAIIIALIFNIQYVMRAPFSSLLARSARSFSIFNQFSILNFQKVFLSPLLAGIGAGGFFFLIWFISRGKWMGLGDAKIGFLMGLFLGFPNILVALFLSFLFGAILGLFLMGLGKKNMKSQLPFGPFLVTGTFVALFWGERIINWYLFI